MACFGTKTKRSWLKLSSSKTYLICRCIDVGAGKFFVGKKFHHRPVIERIENHGMNMVNGGQTGKWGSN